MKAFGIEGPILQWVAEFLTKRKQRVVVNGTFSEEGEVTSGIPQGSVLGPVLFVMYINDLPQCVSNTAKLFADDTKLYAPNTDDPSAVPLQSDLDNLQAWSNEWLIKFHPDKCHVLKLGYHKSANNYHMNVTNTAGQTTQLPLKESDFEKDLGVYVDNDLKFKQHVAQSTAKANRVLGIIRRTFATINCKLFIQLYKALVRPILEYGHTVWEPRHITPARDVEQVQRRATRLTSATKGLNYHERLKKLGLPSLEHRRLRGDMIDTYKYVHGLYNVSQPAFEFAPTEKGTRSNDLKLFRHHRKGDLKKNFFSERVIKDWNELPKSVVNAPSINCFKSRLDAFWKHKQSKFEPSYRL